MVPAVHKPRVTKGQNLKQVGPVFDFFMAMRVILYIKIAWFDSWHTSLMGR